MSGVTFSRLEKTDPINHPIQSEKEIDIVEQRFQEKSQKLMTLQKVNWDVTRIVTPGQTCGYAIEKGLEIGSFCKTDNVQLFHDKEESQALFYEEGQVVAGSATSKIKSKTKRSSEKKRTHIQYDKDRVDQNKKDFQVESKNYLHHVNYDGGHIIDHQFSAQESHTTEENYFPQHFYYNQTIRKVLVQQCDSFIEIPLYTPNPPLIGVQEEKHSHPIPVAMIFIQINDKKIRNVYCFPNAIDYKELSINLNKKAETLASYFCLDPHLHALLSPAIIHNDVSKQTKREHDFMELIDDIAYGMSLSECNDAIQLITELSYSVLHDEDVDPLHCIPEEHYDKIENEPLTPAFNAIGSFLIKYGIKNALKTEALSINSRLIFCNVVIDFIECYHQVSEHALDFVATLGDDFHDTLDELAGITSTMNEQEHLFFINTTLRLSSPHLQAFVCEGLDELYDLDTMRKFFKKTMKLLDSYASKFDLENFAEDAASNIIGIITEVNWILEIIEYEFLEDQLRGYTQTLQYLAEISQKFLAKQEPKSNTYYAEYQTTPTRGCQSKISTAYLKELLKTLADS